MHHFSSFCSIKLGCDTFAPAPTAFSTKDQARTWTCAQFLLQLQQQCYTIQLKPGAHDAHRIRIDRAYIDKHWRAYERCDAAAGDATRLTADNKGFQMMRQLGWSGGALGTSGTGIEEPIQVQSRAKRSGLGTVPPPVPKSRLPERHFEFFESFLRSYATQERSVELLVVQLEYGTKDWRVLEE